MPAGTWKWIVAAVVIVLIVLLVPAMALAQDDGGGGDGGGEEAESISVLELIKASGIIGFFIIALSFVAMALIITNFVELKRDKLVPADLLGEIEQLFEEEEYEQAMALCEAEPSFLTNVIGAALPRLGTGYESMVQAMREVAEEEAVKLHQKISYLSLIGNIAPMCGLLGTVTGMIVAFNKIAASAGAANPAQLASGISMALMTTTLGLIVAIPVMSAFFFLRNRVVRIILEVGAIAEELMERFRPAA